MGRRRPLEGILLTNASKRAANAGENRRMVSGLISSAPVHASAAISISSSLAGRVISGFRRSNVSSPSILTQPDHCCSTGVKSSQSSPCRTRILFSPNSTVACRLPFIRAPRCSCEAGKRGIPRAHIDPIFPFTKSGSRKMPTNDSRHDFLSDCRSSDFRVPVGKSFDRDLYALKGDADRS